MEARIDLHGFGRFEAEDQLKAFLVSSQARGLRAVLVITGQGRRGGGVIRASFEEWLHAAALRGLLERADVAVAPGIGFGEYGDGFVRIGLVENEQRLRQAARNVRRFLETAEQKLHNVIPLETSR